MKTETYFEKLALLALAGLSIIVLAVIAILALHGGEISASTAGVVGVIVTGLIAVGKDIVQAIRSYAMSAQLGKVTDQLAASAPLAEMLGDAPQEAADAAQVVADAAQDKADEVKS